MEEKQFDKIKNYKEWKENQDLLEKELEKELRELQDKYYYEKDLEMETIIGIMYNWAEEQDEIYWEHRNWLSVN